jgi:hypothetical protein
MEAEWHKVNSGLETLKNFHGSRRVKEVQFSKSLFEMSGSSMQLTEAKNHLYHTGFPLI